MSNPAIHVATAARSSHGVGDARAAVIPAHAPSGAMPIATPSQTWHSGVTRFVHE